MSFTNSVDNTGTIATNGTLVFDVDQVDSDFSREFGKANRGVIQLLTATSLQVDLDGDASRRYIFNGGGIFNVGPPEIKETFFSMVITNTGATTIQANELRITFQKVV